MLGEPIRVEDSYALFSDVACHPLCNGKRVGLIERGGRNVYLKSKRVVSTDNPKIGLLSSQVACLPTKPDVRTRPMRCVCVVGRDFRSALFNLNLNLNLPNPDSILVQKSQCV